MKNKLTFFQMMYCWIFVYLLSFKYKRDSPEYFSCTMLSTFRMFNFICISVLLGLVFDFGKGMTSPFMIIQYIVNGSIFILDDFIFFRRRHELLGIFMDYPQKQKLKGRTHFWIYISITILMLVVTAFLTQNVEKPILTI